MKLVNQKTYFILLIISQILLLSGCKSRPSQCSNSYDKNYNGSIKVGNSYSVKGKSYQPQLDYHYNEIGIASWYGHAFHCKKTANGENFNKNQLSAAHKTLPIPSVARVTNLENNRSVEVVINDRGPFSKNRIIDVSEKAAINLGMKARGLAKVRVQFLPAETNALMKKITSKKKIYYKPTTKHKLSKHEITIEEHDNQTRALTTMHKVSKLGKVHLIAGADGKYKVVMIASSKENSKNLLKKIIAMGYKNAKTNYS
ncbi:MAG: septal ring lytic transglycosylase RlpA family protein [Rickettsiales bacterium]